MIRLELHISGMLAVHAKHAVFAALAGVGDLSDVEVELGRVELVAARSETSLPALEAELRAAIAAAGFAVREIRRLPRRLPLV